VRVAIHVRPNASTTRVGGTHDGALVVRVAAPPDQGRATEAALATLAGVLALPRRSVRLVHGATSRRKLVEIDVPADAEAAVGERIEHLHAEG